MRRTRARLVMSTGAVAGALLLAGCGAGAAHVIGPGATGPSASRSTTPTTAVTPTTAAPGASTIPASSAPTTAPTGGVSPSVTNQANQIDSDLNVLNNSLSQAENDLSNPNKGDQ